MLLIVLQHDHTLKLPPTASTYADQQGIKHTPNIEKHSNSWRWLQTQKWTARCLKNKGFIPRSCYHIVISSLHYIKKMWYLQLKPDTTQECENKETLLAFWFKLDTIVTFGAPVTDIKQKKDVFPWSPFPNFALYHCCSKKRKKTPAIVVSLIYPHSLWTDRTSLETSTSILND